MRVLHKYTEILEFSISRCTRERYHVTDVGHTRYKEQQAFKTQSETGMRTGTELTRIQIPPHILHRNVKFFDTGHQLVVVRFTFRTTDNFTDLREKNIQIGRAHV